MKDTALPAPAPPALRLTGAQILRDGRLGRGEVAVSGGLIADGGGIEVDCTGYLLLPGIVDLHGDAFERHLAPRVSAPFSAATALAATDRDAAANGVTTAYLAQSWSWEGGMRGPDFACAVMEALDLYRPRAAIDLRLQIRCETHTPATESRLLEAVRRHRIGYVVFNDHLPEALERRETKPLSFSIWAATSGKSPEALSAEILDAMQVGGEVPDYLDRLALAFGAMGVVTGSHDDRDAATRHRFAAIGARICEFPTTLEAAEAATSAGDPVLLGAPNVVRGGSQAGNAPAIRLIRKGCCEALISDYHYPSLAAAAFRLADEGVMALPEAWAMISQAPARILRLSDRGRIAAGLRADLVLIDPGTRTVEATISGGRIAYLAGGAAERFLAARVAAGAA